jgi:hypothetical protein
MRLENKNKALFKDYERISVEFPLTPLIEGEIRMKFKSPLLASP